MQKTITFWIICLTSVVLYTGCYTLGTVEIEVVKPAKIVIPNQIKSFVLVNNSIMFQETNFNNSVQKGIYVLDTSATQMLVKSVNQILNESPRLDTSILVTDMYYRNQANLLKQVGWNSVDKLCEQNNVDAMISLEAFGVMDTIVSMKYFDGFGYSSYKSLVLIANSMWRIYLPQKHEVIDKKIFRDTLFFEEITTKREYHYQFEYPEAVQYLAEEIALNGAQKVADRIVPYWQPKLRDFFIYSNQEMKKAAHYAYTNNWKSAALIWKMFTDDANTKLAGVACHNMALVCEVEGRLDLAQDWLIESLELYNTGITQNYLKEIKDRINEKQKLDKQFGIDE